MLADMLYALMDVDVRTLIAVLFWGNITSVLLILSYQISSHNVKDRYLTGFYCAGKLCQALAYFCFFFRGELPNAVSITFGNTIFFIGFYFESLAIVTIVQENVRRLYSCLTVILVVSIVAFNVIEIIHPDSSIRIAVASFCILSILAIPNAKFLFSRNIGWFKRIIGFFYLLLILLLFPRAIHALMNNIHIHTNFITQTLTFLSLVLLMVFSLSSYLLLTKEKADKIISTMAKTDFLTNLQNRYSFLDAVKIIFEKHKTEALPVSVLFLDIDYFKKINDTYGHPFGDVVLVRLADIIRQSLRSGDLSCRYGGEEFVVFLPGVDETIGRLVAQRIMDSIAAISFEQHPDFGFTVSVGVMGGVPGEQDTVMTFIENADCALYVAKNAGRNRIELYEPANICALEQPDVKSDLKIKIILGG